MKVLVLLVSVVLICRAQEEISNAESTTIESIVEPSGKITPSLFWSLLFPSNPAPPPPYWAQQPPYWAQQPPWWIQQQQPGSNRPPLNITIVQPPATNG